MTAYACIATVNVLPENCRSDCVVLTYGFPPGCEPGFSELEFSMIWRTIAGHDRQAHSQISEATRALGLGAPTQIVTVSDHLDEMKPDQKSVLRLMSEGDVSYETSGCVGVKRGDVTTRRRAVDALKTLIV